LRRPIFNNFSYSIEDEKGARFVYGPQAIMAKIYSEQLFFKWDSYQTVIDNNFDWEKIKNTPIYNEAPFLFKGLNNLSKEEIIYRTKQFDTLVDQFNEDGTPIENSELTNYVLGDLRNYGIIINLKEKTSKKELEVQEDEQQEAQLEEEYSFEEYEEGNYFVTIELKPENNYFIPKEIVLPYSKQNEFIIWNGIIQIEEDI
jgi:hypothetical protein